MRPLCQLENFLFMEQLLNVLYYCLLTNLSIAFFKYGKFLL